MNLSLHLDFVQDNDAVDGERDLASVDTVPNLYAIPFGKCVRVTCRSCNSCLPVLTLTDVVVDPRVKGPFVAFL